MIHLKGGGLCSYIHLVVAGSPINSIYFYSIPSFFSRGLFGSLPWTQTIAPSKSHVLFLVRFSRSDIWNRKVDKFPFEFFRLMNGSDECEFGSLSYLPYLSELPILKKKGRIPSVRYAARDLYHMSIYLQRGAPHSI